MRRIALIILFISMSFPAFCQVKNGSAKDAAVMWQKNGIVVNDSQGKSVRQNSKAISLDDTSYREISITTENWTSLFSHPAADHPSLFSLGTATEPSWALIANVHR